MKQIIRSKKFAAAVAGVIVAFAAKYGIALDAEMIAVLISPLLMYIAAQGYADRGKEAARGQQKGG